MPPVETLDVGTINLGVNNWPGVLHGLDPATGVPRLTARAGLVQVGGRGGEGALMAVSSNDIITFRTRADSGTLELGGHRAGAGGVAGSLRCVDDQGVRGVTVRGKGGYIGLARRSADGVEETIKMSGQRGEIHAPTVHCAKVRCATDACTIALDGNTGTVVVQSALGGLIDCQGEPGQVIARFSSTTTLGSNGFGGELRLQTEEGLPTVVLSGQRGRAELGADGVAGEAVVMDGSGEPSIELFGGTGIIRTQRGLVCGSEDGGIGVAIDGHNAEIRIRDWKMRVPDFVFDDDHELPALGDVQAFIEQNRHLPGLPSAAEVADSGLPLVEVTLRLLEKVEELMLYTLQQDQQIQALSERLRDLDHGAPHVGR